MVLEFSLNGRSIRAEVKVTESNFVVGCLVHLFEKQQYI